MIHYKIDSDDNIITVFNRVRKVKRYLFTTDKFDEVAFSFMSVIHVQRRAGTPDETLLDDVDKIFHKNFKGEFIEQC